MSGEAELLQRRIMELKEENLNLRISRRVLMGLLDQEQQENEQERKRLQAEIARLKSRNHRLAKYMWEQNKRMCARDAEGR